MTVPSLTTPNAVLTRLKLLPGLALEENNVTPVRLEEVISGYSGELLHAAGRSTPPADGTPLRSALNGLCVDLVVNKVRYDLGMATLDQYGPEETRLLERARAMREADPGTGAFLEIGGAGS